MKTTHTVRFFGEFRRASQRAKGVLAIALSIGTATTGLQAQGPAGGTVRAGEARISGEGTASTRIEQFSDRAIIDWRSFGIGAGDQVVFLQPSAQAATLNRVTGAQVSVILGRLDANGHVLLINPNGVVFGAGAQVNVGSLIASTSNLSNDNFMAGRLEFDQPGKPGAGILNQGALTARDGGLVALVAPHVRNDGVIVARLGKVVLGSADTFTVDLYGDALINLALSDANVGQLRDAHGEPVTSLLTNTGHIDTAGGQTVLMTARNAKSVLDHLINMSGTIQADTAVEQNGRILLLAEGGTVDVTGTLAARGGAGATGGAIQVLGDQVHLGSTAALDASGATGGGTVQVGGAYQGGGDTYRSTATRVDAGATLRANAQENGHGGQVVVWSDGTTQFAGAVEAKGGTAGGDGGLLEVSGKGTLDFVGQADASAAAGHAGSLLLDPAFLAIGLTEASSITRVLRTGTTANLQADVDIDVNAPIFGGDREKGGGLNLTAGHDVHVNDYIVTNDGAVSLTATQGTVTVAPDKGVFAGNQAITVNAAGTIHTGPMLTNGSLSIRSLAGSVAIDAFIDDHTGPVSIKAAGNVDINQPIVNLVTGSPLDVVAGADINVNAQVDGRGGIENGPVAMTAGHDLHVNQAIVTNNGKVALTATGGALDVNAATPMLSGSAAMVLTAQGDIASGPISAGSLNINSTGGAVSVNGIIDASTGDTRIAAASDVNLNQAIVNGQTGSALAVTAGRDVNVNAVVDGRGGVAGGSVALTAARNLTVNDYVLTNNGALDLTATGGAATIAAGKGTFAGTAPIAMRAAGDLTTGAVAGGSLTATSTGGAVRVNGVIDGSTGKVDLTAASDIAINAAVLNPRSGAAFNATAGRDIAVNAPIDGRGGATGGTVTLKASRDVALNNSVVTNNGAIGVTATGGAATMANGTALVSGNAPIAITAGGNVTTGGISGGSLAATSTGGSVSVDGIIDGSTGKVDLNAARDVTINAPVLNTRSGSSLNASAGQNINVNALIDGSAGAVGGAVNLAANRDLNVNASILTRDGAINLSAANGLATVASAVGLFAGSGAVSLDALGNVATGIVVGGATTITSRGGTVTVTGPIAGTGGPMTIGAAGAVNVNQAVINPGTASPLSITAGTDINVNAAVGRTAPGILSSPVTLTAGQNINLNDSIITGNAAITVTAENGTLNTAANQGLFAGAGDVAIRTGGDLTTGAVAGKSLTATSTGGAVTVNGVIDGSTGKVDLYAATDVNINAAVLSPRSGAAFTATAGRDVVTNAPIDGRGGPTAGGTVTLTGARDVALNSSVGTNNGAIGITATSGAATMANGTALISGTAPITMTAAGNVTTGGISGGTLAATSTGGSVLVGGIIDGTTGRVDLVASKDVAIDAPVLSMRSGSSLNAAAGQNIVVNAQIDGTAGVAGGAVNLAATQDLLVNASILTNGAAINLSAANGVATVASPAGLFAGGNAVSVDALGNVSTGTVSGGALTITSRGGSVDVTGHVAGTGGAMIIDAANAVNVNQAITNPGLASPLTINAGTDINVNAAVGRTAAGTPSSAVTLTAGQNVHLNDSIVTENAALSVTAQNGTVTSAPAEGLFAGSANIMVQAGQTLSTGITSTTGAVTLRSTGGAVNVDTAIDGTTGPVTINAATDVNVNQGIANPRAAAPLAITAGNDITVNAKIDGRDADPPTHASGTTTLTASHDITVNQDVITVDRALSLTATNGTVNWGHDLYAGKLFAGNGTIGVTSGADLTTGTTSTAGALNLTSTNGNVNVKTAIDDTTGDVTITAGKTVNVNAAITNLKSGANLLVIAGTDINVAANVDGTSGAVAGGSVNMRASHDVNVLSSGGISTANGTVFLTATNGSVNLPGGVEVIQPVLYVPTNTTYDQITTPMKASISAGNATVILESGDDFVLRSPVQTTGALTLVSTHGDVTTAAPIADTTGAVTISAGDAIVVNREIRTNDQAITLTAGTAGAPTCLPGHCGITINQIVDYDYTLTSSVNPRNANLTLNAVGDVNIIDSDGVATTKTLTIDTRGQLLRGLVGDALPNSGRPESIVLNADGGIGGISPFRTGFAGSVVATSSNGSIDLNVTAPDKLRVTTGTPGTLDCPTCDIHISSGAYDTSIGPDVVLNAGGSVNMSDFRSTTVDLTARSGDINFNQAITSNSLVGAAGRDIVMHSLFWMGAAPNMTGGGPVTLTAGRDIVTSASSPIHVSNGQALTFAANRNLTLFVLETLGAVSLTATTGNITLNNDIGGHIVNGTSWPAFNPADLGVASLSIFAPAATATINMQGARAQGNVTISTGGTLTAAKQITSVFGTVSIFAAGGATLSAVPIGNVPQVDYPSPVSPIAPPGPKSPLPGGPGSASNGAPGSPVFAEIPVSFADQNVGGVITPGAANGSVGFSSGGTGSVTPNGTIGGVGRPGAANGAVGLDAAGSNGTGSPDRTTGVAGRPGAAIGSIINAATGTSDPATADTAAALRTAGQSCGEETGEADNGLAAIDPNKPEAADQKKASCPPAETAGQAAAGTPAGTPTSAPTAPAGTDPTLSATPASPIGGGLQ